MFGVPRAGGGTNLEAAKKTEFADTIKMKNDIGKYYTAIKDIDRTNLVQFENINASLELFKLTYAKLGEYITTVTLLSAMYRHTDSSKADRKRLLDKQLAKVRTYQEPDTAGKSLVPACVKQLALTISEKLKEELDQTTPDAKRRKL